MSLPFFLNRLVTVEAPTDARDASGGVTRTWAAVPGATSFPASVQPMTARERYLHAQRRSFVTHKIYTDRDPLARLGYRVRDDVTGQTFVLEAVMNTAGQDRLWVMEAREQSP